MKKHILIFAILAILSSCKKSNDDSQLKASYSIETRVDDLSSYTLYEPNGGMVDYIATGTKRNASAKIIADYNKGSSVRIIATLKPDSKTDQIEVIVTNLSTGEVFGDKKAARAEVSFTAD